MHIKRGPGHEAPIWSGMGMGMGRIDIIGYGKDGYI